DMGDRVGDEVIEAREVIGGRSQRKSCPAGNGAVADRLESAFAQQLGGGADQRVPSTFSLGSNRCRHLRHAASQLCAASPFPTNARSGVTKRRFKTPATMQSRAMWGHSQPRSGEGASSGALSWPACQI